MHHSHSIARLRGSLASCVQTFLIPMAPLGALLLSACASTGSGGPTSSSPAATSGSASALASAATEPLAEPTATIQVAGLACPKCATNVEVQLRRIPGVRVENIDMKHGWVQVHFDEMPHPSPARLGRAVEDSGLTYLGVQSGSVGTAAPATPNLGPFTTGG